MNSFQLDKVTQLISYVNPETGEYETCEMAYPLHDLTLDFAKTKPDGYVLYAAVYKTPFTYHTLEVNFTKQSDGGNVRTLLALIAKGESGSHASARHYTVEETAEDGKSKPTRSSFAASTITLESDKRTITVRDGDTGAERAFKLNKSMRSVEVDVYFNHTSSTRAVQLKLNWELDGAGHSSLSDAVNVSCKTCYEQVVYLVEFAHKALIDE